LKKQKRPILIEKKDILKKFEYDKKNGTLIYKIPPKNFKSLLNKPVTSINKGYLETHIMGRAYKIHRLVWFLENDSWPKHQIDHINGIKTDNRIENLRDVTNGENQRNKEVNRNGKPPGIRKTKNGKKWSACIKANGKFIHIGTFENQEMASLAYKNKCKEYGI